MSRMNIVLDAFKFAKFLPTCDNPIGFLQALGAETEGIHIEKDKKEISFRLSGFVFATDGEKWWVVM